ncbi:MAG: hypothetical protein ABI946_08555 [Chthoniobacterales bacterium]
MAVSTATTEAVSRGLDLPDRSWRHELAAIRIVWQRDLIRFWQDRTEEKLSPLLEPVAHPRTPGVQQRPEAALSFLRVFRLRFRFRYLGTVEARTTIVAINALHLVFMPTLRAD